MMQAIERDVAAPAVDLPPVLTARTTPVGSDPHLTAICEATAARSGAGDVWWSVKPATMAFSIVLEPDVARARCYEMLPLVMVAFADALGTLAPPEVAVQYRWPATILVNGAKAGRARFALDPNDGPDGLPGWVAVGLEAALAPSADDPEPGHEPDRTTLAEEGCGTFGGQELIEVTARHLLAWLDAWEQDGFAPVHRHWTFGWADRACALDVPGRSGIRQGCAVGIDEHGGLLLKTEAATIGIGLEEALATAGDEQG